jgi:hypothetical protein
VEFIHIEILMVTSIVDEKEKSRFTVISVNYCGIFIDVIVLEIVSNTRFYEAIIIVIKNYEFIFTKNCDVIINGNL